MTAKIQKFGNGGAMVEGSHRHGVYVSPRDNGRFDIQAGVGLCQISRDELRLLGEAMVEIANREPK